MGQSESGRRRGSAPNPPGLPSGTARTVPTSWRDLAVVAIVLVWIVSGLGLDSGVEIWTQRAIGVGTWLLLIALLRGEEPAVRAQIAVLVVIATLVEYTAAPLLGFYTYRLENVPAFVPPGHGIVYLGAIALGRAQAFQRLRVPVMAVALVTGAAWALWGVTAASRGDALGMLLFVLFAGFVLTGRAPLTYCAAFFVTSYLELVGTWIGTWAWAYRDPTGWLSIGNPPSGIPGGYCMLDAAALALGPATLNLFGRLRGWLALPRPGSQTAEASRTGSIESPAPEPCAPAR